MKLAELIRADKTNLEIGDWHSGHIARRLFPLSRVPDKRYKLGKAYLWKVISFNACGELCKILLELNEEKEIFYAMVGVEKNGDMVILCKHEFHSVEPGWHCHFTREDHANASKGSLKRDLIKWPKKENFNTKFNVTEDNAVTIAARLFKFEKGGTLI